MTRRAFFKVAFLHEELPDDPAHTPCDDQDGGVGFLASRTVFLVKRAEVRRAINCYPTGLD